MEKETNYERIVDGAVFSAKDYDKLPRNHHREFKATDKPVTWEVRDTPPPSVNYYGSREIKKG